MKRILLLIFLINTVLSVQDVAFNELVQGNNEFSTKLHNELVKSNQNNFVVSPLSLNKALTLTALGTKGDTASELNKILSLPSDTQKIKDQFQSIDSRTVAGRFSTLISANKIFIEKGFGISPEYLSLVVNDFNAEVENLNFGDTNEAANKVNQWVQSKTNGNIKELVKPDDLNELTRVILANCLYFKGQWVHVFKKENTKPMTFHKTKDESVQVDAMQNVAYLKYGSDENMKADYIDLPYRGTEVVLTIVLPKEIDGLNSIEKNMNTVLEFHNYTQENVKLFLPKFRAESFFNLIPTLQNIGVKKLFNRDADLSGISIKEGLYVSHVVQKVFFNVDEVGTEAAAATAVISNARSAIRSRKPKLEIKVDRPFLFFLKLNGLVLFSGRISSL